MSVSKLFQFLFIFLSAVDLSCSKCKTTYMTFCESLDDLKRENLGELEWTEMVIGSDNSTPNETVFLSDLRFESWPNLKTFSVIKKIIKLEKKSKPCLFSENNLDLMVFYGNNFAHIEPKQFRPITTKKLSLINNKIKNIQPYSFLNIYKVEILDLSDNLLEAIESNVLPNDGLMTLIISKNRLNFIESDSLPSTLKHLDLSYNNLRYISNDVTENLKNLQILKLSNNKIKQAPDLSFMINLYRFDISHNFLVTIGPEKFQSLRFLQLVDLSHNYIENSDILSYICPRNNNYYDHLTISLAFNRLSDLNLTGIENWKKLTLVLYGNPWSCKWFNEAQKTFFQQQTKCDLNYFCSGFLPYCLDYTYYGYYDYDRIDNYTNTFYNIVNRKTNLIDCNLGLQDIKVQGLMITSRSCVW